MKYIYSAVLGLLGLAMFQACQSDPVFPDPGFEIGDQRVEVRRDTADYYDISFKMNVPNGVDHIDLLDATDYTLLDEIDEFNGKTNFDFNYRVDLTEFEKDTVLNYIIKVVDKDARSTNRGIRIDVKGFSFPEIRLVGGTSIAVAAPVYNVRGIISTGLNTISTVKVLFEGEEQYSFTATPEDMLYEMTLKTQVFVGELEEGQEYTIEVIITDDKGQESITPITVRKSDFVKKPKYINYSNYLGSLITITPTYDDQDRLVVFDYTFSNGTNHHNEFSYNELNMVDTISYRTINSSGTYSRITYTYINYVEGTTQISSIEEQIFNTDDNGNVTSIGSVNVESDEFVYNEKGEVVSFFTSSRCENIDYQDPFGLGESIFSEFWQDDSYLGSNTVRRQHREGYDPILIPTFEAGLPPFVKYNDIMLNAFNDLLWHKYIMTKTVPTDPSYSSSYLREPSYTYQADADGNITSINKLYNKGTSFYYQATEVYSFFY
ncbi:hypothetical protein [Aestuariibaculum lutulentum]|uniref:DUF4595 domain-containing protein n=1 Tax=Aestuariibaculum lutulentum TaxID=2920935 RepID=A0ABS9RET9_9FLAO|nr:hypothetical protein [Aestuariibaculum lutulentum]MCH4551455.1 hypothetical protein [Aestuariibaculum lutulentum]